MLTFYDDENMIGQAGEAALHPFRRLLPPSSVGLECTTPRLKSWLHNEDAHLFMFSFGAFFFAITGFIA
ncbi:MAG: hypothetical protein B7Y00_01845 [Sphingomonadales bacterium 17-56-6]|nr:MAG: hypothetical protein B7Y00_01845 [Sphingomonadales bacterium 17-56-6]